MSRTMNSPPYLQSIMLNEDRVGDRNAFPFNLRITRKLKLAFRSSVTFLVGENGSGKSTLMEAIAQLCRLPVSGGGRNELERPFAPKMKSLLASACRAAFKSRPIDAFFFRAEYSAHFASLLDDRKKDPDFWGDPYHLYGGKSLHERSHGEGFFALFENRLESGLYLMDEPESALSPQRQLALLVRMSDLVADGDTQFIVATHSPILMTFPGAEIISLDLGKPKRIPLQETSHYRITKGILDSPERYWKYLLEE